MSTIQALPHRSPFFDRIYTKPEHTIDINTDLEPWFRATMQHSSSPLPYTFGSIDYCGVSLNYTTEGLTSIDPYLEDSTSQFHPTIIENQALQYPSPQNPTIFKEGPWNRQISAANESYAFCTPATSQPTSSYAGSPPLAPLMEAIIDQTTTFNLPRNMQHQYNFPLTTTTTSTQIPTNGFNVSIQVQNTFSMPSEIQAPGPYTYQLQQRQQQPESLHPQCAPSQNGYSDYSRSPSYDPSLAHDPSYDSYDHPNCGSSLHKVQDSRIRKKRKVFNKMERTKVNQIRSIRACLRCRVNKRSCSADDDCSECLSFIKRANLPMSALKYICFRSRLQDIRFSEGKKPTAPATHDLYLDHFSHITTLCATEELTITAVYTSLCNLYDSNSLTLETLTNLISLKSRNSSSFSVLPPTSKSRPSAQVQPLDRTNHTPYNILSLFTLLTPKRRPSPPPTKLPKKPLLSSPSELPGALISLTTLLFVLPLTDIRTRTVLDTLELMLLQETDRLLNSLVLAPAGVKRASLEDLVKGLGVWEVRYELGGKMRKGLKWGYGLGQDWGIELEGMGRKVGGVRKALVGRVG